MLGTIIGIVLIVIMGMFSIFSCILASRCDEYFEEYEVKNDDKGSTRKKH